MNDEELERRLARLRPADLPGGLSRQLHDLAPAPDEPAVLPLRAWASKLPSRLLRPWGLAYVGLGVAWVLILGFHLFTQAATPSGTADDPVLASSTSLPSNSAPAPMRAFASDRIILLTRSNLDASLP